MTRRIIVREGQCYAQSYGVRFRPSVWQVGSVKTDSATIPHAQLVNVEDPLQTKTISCVTLINRIYYELINDAANAQSC